MLVSFNLYAEEPCIKEEDRKYPCSMGFTMEPLWVVIDGFGNEMDWTAHRYCERIRVSAIKTVKKCVQ